MEVTKEKGKTTFKCGKKFENKITIKKNKSEKEQKNKKEDNK